jgi:hypothetical protein
MLTLWKELSWDYFLQWDVETKLLPPAKLGEVGRTSVLQCLLGCSLLEVH